MFVEDALTEDRWLQARSLDDAGWMIRRMWQETEHPSARKSQLVACACARLVWHLLLDERSRRGVDVAERYLDGMAARSEMESAAAAVFEGYLSAERDSQQCWASIVAGVAARLADHRFDDWKAPNALRHLRPSFPLPMRSTVVPDVVLDIFGNPFRPVTINPAWQPPTVVALAQAAYDERILPPGTLEPARLAILADALEEAGCDSADLLNHLRQPGEHVRGCWAVDAILGKE
jgi:hypothetical protein